MNSDFPSNTWDWTLVTSVLAIPALLAVIAAGVLAGALFGVHPLWSEPDLNLAEAAAMKDRGTIQRLISHGVDPNAPARVRPGLLTSEALTVTPLEASVGTRTASTMELLLSRGARMDDDARAVVVCLAVKEEAEEILTYLDEHGARERPDCEHVATPW